MPYYEKKDHIGIYKTHVYMWVKHKAHAHYGSTWSVTDIDHALTYISKGKWRKEKDDFIAQPRIDHNSFFWSLVDMYDTIQKWFDDAKENGIQREPVQPEHVNVVEEIPVESKVEAGPVIDLSPVFVSPDVTG